MGAQSPQQLEEFTEGEITAGREAFERSIQDAGAVVQDTTRGLITLGDNVTSDALYTVRDAKSEFLHTIDSGVDHLADVADRVQTNVFQTIQVGGVLIVGFGAFFIILHGEQMFQQGVRLGRINLF